MQSSTIVAETGFRRHVRDAAVRSLRETTWRTPGLDVSLVASVAGHPEARGPVVIARVAGEQDTVCLSLHVDGHVVETWTPGASVGHFDGRRIPAGRHVVTARAIDAAGRWGGASIVVEVRAT